MQTIKNGLLLPVIVAMAAMVCLACAKKVHIDVDYRLPAGANPLTGHTVFLQTTDHRIEPALFSPRAASHFEHFSGQFVLTLETADEQREPLGAYPLPKLFEAALKQRLHQLGIAVVDSPRPDIPLFDVKLNRFRIDLIGQKWLAEIGYEASLTQGQRVARETVSGSAERLKIMGSGGAEKMIAEIFTDLINRLNIEGLFQQAGG